MASKNKPVRSPHKSDDPEQSKLFIEKTREIGAEEEKSAAGELLGRKAKMPPNPRKKPIRSKRAPGRV